MSEISANRSDDPSLEELLTRIAQYAVRFEPADLSALQQTTRGLSGIGKPDMPADYMAFLKLTNGLLWNGIQLFGTEDLPRPRGFTVPSLVSANKELPDGLSGADCLVIGRTEDEWLVVKSADGTAIYQEMDRLGGDIYRQAASLQRMLTRIIKERMPR